MLYVWLGYLKSDTDPVAQQVQRMTTDFLRQPSITIWSAGPLRDADGKRSAMMMIFEHESREAAEAFVRDSPYLEAGLYEDHRLFEYDNEVG